MKISVITISYRDGALLRRAIDSVYSQALPEGVELEHIIVCSDTSAEAAGICDYARGKGSEIIVIPPKGCYNALNAGIRRATGDIVGILHGSDMYTGTDSLARVAGAFQKHNPDFIYGDVHYIKASAPGKALRYYSGRDFTPDMMLRGIAPPHPSLYIRRDILLESGLYKEDYLIGADFDLFARLFFGGKELKWFYLPGALTAMELGGLSTKFYNTIVVNTREKLRALRENGLPASLPKVLSRYLWHINRK